MKTGNTKITSVHAGHRQRMREKYLKSGFENFEDHEILEFMLFYAIPYKDTNEIAHNLLNSFGSLAGVVNAPIDELKTINGISDNSAIFIHMIPDLYRRYSVSKQIDIKTIFSLKQAGKYFCQRLSDLVTERVEIMFLSSSQKILWCGTLGDGTISCVNISIKEIVSLAAKYNAAFAILAHNHPSGEISPSKDDIIFTHCIFDALKTIDVELLDHFIVAGKKHLSLKELGYLNIDINDIVNTTNVADHGKQT